MKQLTRQALILAALAGLVTYYLAAAEQAPKEALKKIVAGKPTRLERDNPAWKDKGRIVGLLRQCPSCKIEALDAEGKVSASSTPKAGADAYEMEWLAGGVYTLKVTAEGYQTLELKNLEVRVGGDLRVNIEFEQ